MKHFCSQCNKEVETVQKPSGPHVGEYCPDCNKWIAWVVQERPYDPNWVVDFGKHAGTKISELETDYLRFMIDSKEHGVKGGMRLQFIAALNERYMNFIKVVNRLSAAAFAANTTPTTDDIAAGFKAKYPQVSRERFDEYVVGIIVAVYHGELKGVKVHINNGCIAFEC